MICGGNKQCSVCDDSDCDERECPCLLYGLASSFDLVDNVVE